MLKSFRIKLLLKISQASFEDYGMDIDLLAIAAVCHRKWQTTWVRGETTFSLPADAFPS